MTGAEGRRLGDLSYFCNERPLTHLITVIDGAQCHRFLTDRQQYFIEQLRERETGKEGGQRTQSPKYGAFKITLNGSCLPQNHLLSGFSSLHNIKRRNNTSLKSPPTLYLGPAQNSTFCWKKLVGKWTKFKNSMSVGDCKSWPSHLFSSNQSIRYCNHCQ